MNRKDLDAFVDHYNLSEPAVREVLEIAGARPSRTEELQFVMRGLLLAGVLSLTAGVIFFVAANWDALRTLGRFVLLEIVFVAAIGIAIWKPPPATLGRLAMLAAFIVAGALFALFGQTYQTGADVYELFLTWALIGLPVVFAGQWSVLWGAWLLVLNVSLALYCGWQPRGGPLWWLLSGSGLQTSLLLMLAALVNLALWSACEAITRLRPAGAAAHQLPPGLRRFLLACGLLFATAGGIGAILGGVSVGADPGLAIADGWALALLGAMLAGVAAYALRRRRDVFPVAMIAGSLIALGAVALGRHLRFEDTGVFFVLALWLAVSSTIAGQLLMRLVRAWRDEAHES